MWWRGALALASARKGPEGRWPPGVQLASCLWVPRPRVQGHWPRKAKGVVDELGGLVGQYLFQGPDR